MRRVIDECGRWQLAISGEHVVASYHAPGQESIWVTTERIDPGGHSASEYGLTPLEVIKKYRRLTSTETSQSELIREVSDSGMAVVA